MSIHLNIMTDGPADPLYVLELAEGFAEIARTLNHLTRHHESLHYPAEADELIREISSAAGRLPQLLEQVSGWLEAEQAAGRIGVADGSPWSGEGAAPSGAVAVARIKLEQAQAHARMLQQALDAAAAVTCDMAAVQEDGSDE